MAGIYIHIPFCKQRCSYCDFHFSTTYQPYREQLIQSLSKELELRKDYLEEKVETVYFGGGTPSLLTKEELEVLLIKVRQHYFLEEEIECTLESNPDDITPEKLEEWKDMGINRLSIGLQSFKEADLKWMNRAHNSKESYQSVLMAQRSGFTNITIDLMYGLPELTLDEWRGHIQKVIDLDVPHISAYCLTVEQKTALAAWVKKGEIHPAEEEQQSEQFEVLVELLTAAGYEHYEISNFAKPEAHSRHNSNYWRGKHYLGIGPSAHSFNGVSRSWNLANNQLYIHALENKKKWMETEELSSEDRFNELLLTGLRTKWGVALSALEDIHPLGSTFRQKVQQLKDEQLMKEEGDYLHLTTKGKLQADRIASDLFLG